MKNFFRILALALVLFSVSTSDVVRDDPPSTFDLRDYNGENFVTAVKSQSGGTCWTHGTMSAMESNLLMTDVWSTAGETGEPNLAEYHLDWWNGFNQHNNDDIPPPDGEGLQVHFGGDYLVSAAYIARGEGAVRDIDGQSYTTPPDRSSPDWHYYYPRDIVWLSVNENLSDIDTVKNVIMQHGAIGTCILTAYLYGTNQYQPYSDNADPDHAVAIIGWNDNFTISGAPGPGAWLCKNSWGASWGISGYFWTSYYDRHCGHHPEMGAVSFQNIEPWAYDKVYYHDYHGWRDTKEDCTEAFNYFLIEEGGYIKAVSFITAAHDIDYTLKIFGSFDGTQLTNELSNQSGHITYSGLHTIDLVPPVFVEDGEAVVHVELSDGGHAFDRTSEIPVLLGKKYRTSVTSSSSVGESYYLDGGDWVDLWDFNQTANFCMKALTETRISFEVDTIIGWAPLEVNSEATTEMTVDSWMWNFGDGSKSDSHTSSYTYTESGIYDISVTAYSADSSFTAVRRECVAVLADTMWADSISISGYESICVTISGNNTIPLHQLKIPVVYEGDLGLSYDSASKVGCRTEHFQSLERVQYDPSHSIATFMLSFSAEPGARHLQPGSGPILKLYFSPTGDLTSDMATEIDLSGYSTYQPRFSGGRAIYRPGTHPGQVEYLHCCQGIRGNVNLDDEDRIDISDLVYMVTYMFSSGPEPLCWEEANINGDLAGDITHTIDINDLVWLVEYMFNGGPAPAVCLGGKYK